MGIRYGGRAKGTPNKRTAEARLQAMVGVDKPLARDMLEEIAEGFIAQYRLHVPLPGEQPTPDQEAGMDRWGKNCAEVCAKLAPYQSPTYKAVFMPDQHDMGSELTDFWLNVFERPRKPLLLEHKGNGKDQ